MNKIWKYFPVVYLLPFLFATTRFEQLSLLSEVARWAVLIVGCTYAFQGDWQRGPRNRQVFSLVDGAVMLFLGLAFASCLWSISPLYTVQRAGSMVLLYGCSFWAIWRYIDQFSEDRFWFLLLRTLGAVMTANFFISSLLFPSELLGGRFQGFFENPNNIGLVVGVSLPPAFLFWLRKRTKIELGVVVILCLNLGACGTRSAALGAAVAILGIMFSLLKKKPAYALPLVLTILIGAGAFSQTEYFAERILREGSLENMSTRQQFWDLARTYIAREPALGHGFGTDHKVHAYYGVGLWSLNLRGYGMMSSYYGLAVMMGKPLAYLFFISIWSYVLVNLLRFKQSIVITGYLMTLVSGLLVCIVEPALFSAGNSFSYLFWAVMMMAVRRIYYHSAGIPLAPDGGLRKRKKRRAGKPRAAQAEKSRSQSQPAKV